MENSRRLAKTWSYPFQRHYEEQMCAAAITWFSQRDVTVHRKHRYMLANRDDWQQNIILAEVAEYIQNQWQGFPLHKNIHHGPHVVEYESDSDLHDYEQVPLLEEGGIEAFIEREVLPYVPDAWVDESWTRTGYEISFTRYFYKPQKLRCLRCIRRDILALEQETEGLLDQILNLGAE